MTGKSFGRRPFLLGSAAATAAGGLALPRVASAATNITYWHHFTSQSEFAGLRDIMNLFGKADPTISVTQENIPNPDFMAKFTAAVVSNSRPDTTMIAMERVSDMVAMKGLVDLTPRINQWNLKQYFDAKCWNGVTRDGKIYGTPAFTFVDWMYYRKDWFEEAGIAGPPQNFAEFTTAAEKLTDPKRNRYGFGMRGGAGGADYVIDVLLAYGSPIVQDGKPAIDRKLAIEAIGWWSSLYTKLKVVPPSAPNDSYSQIMQAFRTGQTGMIWHHTGSLAEISGSLKPNVQFMTMPIPAGPATRFAHLSYAYNGIMKPEHEDAGWDWVSFWGETDPAIALLKETGYFPASSQVAKDPRITSNPIYQAAIETVGFGKIWPQFAGMPGWTYNVVLPAFQSILVGRSTVEQAVDTILQGLEQALH
jgi:multiple sugar transport system substrate-binding protein